MTEEPDIVISSDKPLRLSADAMRSLKKATGLSMTEMINDEDDEANRIQIIAFAELHRRGVVSGHLPDAATLWEQAGSVLVDFAAAETLDPTAGESSTTSPSSAASGA